MSSPTEISFREFLRIFKDNEASKSESRFCFILGAGASVSSGIKSGASLAKEWIKTIEEDLLEADFNTWIKDSKIDKDSPELDYPKIYQKRFENNRKSGHEALMSVMTDKEPSVGYPFFAQLLVKTDHNIVITTNFDSLLESSIYRYTNKQPLVIGHENLAHFLNSSAKRPIIAKIHRDLLLDPKNDTEGTSSLPKEWQQPLKQILETTHIVVVGYGGNDGSLMDFLETLENRNGIYWCKRETSKEVLPAKVTGLLKKDSDRIVNIPDFDGLMIELADIFKCPELIDKDSIENSPVVKAANVRANNFQRQIDDYAKANKESAGADSTIQKLVSHWYDYQIKVDATEDADEKDAIYKQGIDETNHPSLIGNYANFLHRVKKDAAGAEQHYLKALALMPDDADFNGNYALFLHEVKKDAVGAERYYLKALELEPESANNNGNYAYFLHNVKKDAAGAEQYYFKALALEPESANNNGNYAGFLFSIGKYELAGKNLELAWRNLTPEDSKELSLECYFYEYAHVESRREKAETELLALLDQGVVSTGFDLSQNVTRAIADGHPYPDKLREYAERISSE